MGIFPKVTTLITYKYIDAEIAIRTDGNGNVQYKSNSTAINRDRLSPLSPSHTQGTPADDGGGRLCIVEGGYRLCKHE